MKFHNLLSQHSIKLTTGAPAILYVLGRGGNKSDEMWVIEYKNRIYTPYGQVKLNIICSSPSVLKIMYGGPILKELVYADNPVFKVVQYSAYAPVLVKP